MIEIPRWQNFRDAPNISHIHQRQYQLILSQHLGGRRDLACPTFAPVAPPTGQIPDVPVNTNNVDPPDDVSNAARIANTPHLLRRICVYLETQALARMMLAGQTALHEALPVLYHTVDEEEALEAISHSYSRVSDRFFGA